MRFFLGIDGGGSKCDAVLLNESGVVLGWGVGGPVNYRPMEDVAQSFDDALSGALAAYEGGELHVGLIAGRGQASQWLAQRGIAAEFVGVGEARGGYLAALEPWGIMVLSGTGSFIHGRRPDGQRLHIGGLGPVMGDEGSAYDLGLRACRAALRSEWCAAWHTSLAEAVVRALGSPDLASIVNMFHGGTIGRGRMATLAPLVDHAALAGDGVARDIMVRAARGLAELLGVALDELGIRGQSYPVFGLGGLAQGSPLYWDFFAAEARRCDPTLRISVPPVRLAIGAAFGAMADAGVEINRTVRDTVVATQGAFPPSRVNTRMTVA